MSPLRTARAALIISVIGAGTSRAQPAPSPNAVTMDATDRRIPNARPGAPLSLADALLVAIRQSPAITRAVIDIEAARAGVLAAQGVDDLTLTAVAGFTRSQRFQIRDTYVQDAAQLGVGLARNLHSGGTISGNLSGQVVGETFEPDGGGTSDRFTGLVTNLSASLTHPLLRGFGARIARADQRRASVARDVATLQQTVEAIDLVRDVIVAYWRVAYARQIVDIRTESLKLAIEQLRITNTAVRTGSVSPTEVLGAEQAIALREQALLEAQVAVSELSLNFRHKVGLEIGRDRIDLAPTTPAQPPRQPFDVDATIAQAIKDNPLLALLEAKGKSSALEVELAEDAIRPRLDLQASLGTTGRAAGAVDSFKQLGMLEHPSFSIALGYEQQLGARAARGERDRAQSARRRTRVDLEEARRAVTVSVAHEIDLLRAAQKRIEVSDRAIDLAQRTLEIQQTRFLNGKATNFDVVLRQDELQQARTGRALAVSDALIAEATLLALTGELLDRHHVRITAPTTSFHDAAPTP